MIIYLPKKVKKAKVNDDTKIENKPSEKKPEEKIEYPTISYFRLQYSCAENYDYLCLFIGLMGSMGMGVSMPIFSFIFGGTINNFGPQNGPNDFVDRINIMVLRFVYCAIGVFFASFLMITFFSINGKRVVRKLKSKYFETIMKQEQGYFDKANPFEYATKVQNQTKVIESGLGDKVGNSIMSTTMFIASFIIGFTTSWKLSLALCAIVPFLGIGGYFFTKELMEGFTRKQKEYEKAGGLAEEVVYNIKTVASFGNMEKEVEGFDKLLENSMDAAIENGLKSGFAMGIVFALIYVTYAVAIWYGAYLIANKEYNSNTNAAFQAGDVMTVLFSIVFGAFALGQASPNIKAINDAISAASELFWLIDRKPLIDLDHSKLKPKKEDIHGQISFEDVTFAYPSEPNKEILKKFTFNFQAGKKNRDCRKKWIREKYGNQSH
jgi:ATP-binding cassette subfamily B (MDR/TAP) protein 1